MTVRGSLDLRGTAITSLPDGLTVGGSLDLQDTAITSLPDGLTVGGFLDLLDTAITSLPDGLTVGGSLNLRGAAITSLPDGLTVGGSLYFQGKKTYIGNEVAPVNQNLFWKFKGNKYALIDGIFCEIKNSRDNTTKDGVYTIYEGKGIGKNEYFFIVNQGAFYAHGAYLKSAYEDLQFKIVSERLKHDPIKADTIITINHYRAITGACKMGCADWLKSNFPDAKKRKDIIENGILAKDILPILKKENAYGLSRFEKLVSF
jgi:hypothetical protein